MQNDQGNSRLIRLIKGLPDLCIALVCLTYGSQGLGNLQQALGETTYTPGRTAQETLPGLLWQTPAGGDSPNGAFWYCSIAVLIVLYICKTPDDSRRATTQLNTRT